MSRQNAENPVPGRFRGVFNSIDKIGEMGGWAFDFRQLEAGSLSLPASFALGSHVAVMRVKSDRGFHQMGSPPPGALTFGIPAEGLEDWFDRPYRSQSIVPFHCPSGLDGVSRRGFEATTIAIDENFLLETAEIHQIPVADILISPQSGAFIPNSRTVQRVRRLLECLLNDDAARLGEEEQRVLIVELLSAALSDSCIEDKSTPAARARTITMALEYIKMHQHEAVVIGEICAATGVPVRTLSRSFRERFGIGPKAYLQNARLTAVRADLIEGSEEAVIAEVANNWGFWHMGQFARDYRRMFGELPSTTLRRSVA